MEPSEGRWRIQVGLRRHYAEHSARIASFNPHDAPTLARSQPASQRQDWGSNPGLSARARAPYQHVPVSQRHPGSDGRKQQAPCHADAEAALSCGQGVPGSAELGSRPHPSTV